MRVPEISLGYGLLAQNKHDLCRYYKYTERHKQTQYLPAYTVSFMVVPSVRAWEFIHQLSSESIYAEDGIPDSWQKKERFLLYRNPCYILRKRMDGALKAIEQIIEHVE